ncbi:MAG: hypothetical protein WCJ35_28620 [Planctomycetota bacterium]
MARLDVHLLTIAKAVKVMHTTYTSQRWFDGHALTNHLDDNDELAEIHACYADASDPQMTGDQQIGKSLYKLGQEKIDTVISDRRITTPDGDRNGRCAVTRWVISAQTTKAIDDWLARHRHR